MKKYLFTLFFIFYGVFLFAQSNFSTRLKANLIKLEKSSSIQDYDTVFNEFTELVRINDNDGWKAYYYAGIAQYKKAELLINSNDFANASEANAIAYKYVNGSMQHQRQDVKKLFEQIATQKKVISSKSNLK